TSHPEKLKGETVDSLIGKWQSYVKQLADYNIDAEKVVRYSLITPSCGAGSLSHEGSVRVLKLLKDVSEELRKLYFS
ncbi:MAG: hypothetical protein KAJ00_03580, partial [Deltaproteobacteria bacterium]|nr:hypothetical protein [Deltaproteobacteria bacterium]